MSKHQQQDIQGKKTVKLNPSKMLKGTYITNNANEKKIPPLKVIKITIICIKRSKPPSHLLQSSSLCTNPYLSLQPHHLLPSGPLFQLPLRLHFLHTTQIYPFHPVSSPPF